MASDERQRKAFEFFIAHLESQEPFSKAEFGTATGWGGTTLDTYWSKQFKPFLVDAQESFFRVSEAFRPFADWERFQQHVTQVRRVAASDYQKSTYDKLLIFEFFMPLTNEAALRTTLDALFFKDTVIARLKTVDSSELQVRFKKEPDEPQEHYLDRVCSWVSSKFLGYSVSHVSGRFRSERLSTRKEVASMERHRRYLIDETTAVTRFIFPCENDEGAEQVRWFFDLLFVNSIIQVVNGEDEIWMVESGLRNRIHIWRIEDEKD